MAIALPPYLKPKTNGLSAAMSGGLGVAQPPRVSLADDRFTLLGENGEPNRQVPAALTIDVVFVGANEHASRTYYDGPFDRDNASAPVCWSDNGQGPSIHAQSPQSENCATCPMSVWGSKINANGKQVPACTQTKKAAVLVVGDPTGVVYLLNVPPASIKTLRGYIASLGGHGVEPDQVITRLSMTQKELGFNMVDFIPENFVEPIAAIMASGKPDDVVGANDSARVMVMPPRVAGPASVRQISASPEDRREPQTIEHAPQALMSTSQPRAQGLGIIGLQGAGPPAEKPARRRRTPAEMAAERGETLVAAGPIPPQVFSPPATTDPKLERIAKLRAEMEALERGEGAPAEAQGGFIGGPAPTPPAFGIGAASPASAQINGMLDKVMGLPTVK